MIAIGNINASKVYLGDAEVGKIYLGGTQVWGGSEPGPTPVPYVDWLKSLGCICWLPLGSEGELLDRISGESLETTGNGTLAWSSTFNLYRFQVPSSVSQYTAFLDNGMSASSFPNNCFTVLTSFKRYNTETGYTLYDQLSPISPNDENARLSLNTVYNGTGNVSNLNTNTLFRLFKYEGSDGRFYGQEGAIYGSSDTPATQYLPSNWVTTANGLAVGVVRLATNAYAGKSFYLKDVYIFNTKLTLEQIRQIQGFDPLPSNVIDN